MVGPVFISYARKTNRENARALRDELGADSCFLDEQDLEIGDTFPKELTDALLASRVLVAFVDSTYFKRWYCLREWMLARAPFDELVKRESSAAQREAALSHVVVALAEDVGDHIVRRLPAPLQVRNWPATTSTAHIAALVRSRLKSAGASLAERCDQANVPSSWRSAMVDQAAVPPPRNLAGVPMHPKGLPTSLREVFVGRTDDLWRLHAALVEPRLGSLHLAALSGAVQGGGGFGKTRLALEYVHRFGPIDYRGGLFWIDASEAEPLERQLHGVLHELRRDTPPIETMREHGRDVRAELETELHEVAATQSMLFVLDNVPEPKAGTPPPALERWCPALGKVTCLATSRKRLDALGGIVSIDVDTLAPDDAVALLTRDVVNAHRSAHEWRRVADWVGHLPLALTLLNAALRAGATTQEQLLRFSSENSATMILDAQMEALRDTVPAGALRGVTETFALSFDLLDEPARVLARKIAWLAPALLPNALSTALAAGADGARALAMLADRSLLVGTGQSSSASGRWQMHRLVADFLRSRSASPVDDCKATIQTLAALLNSIDLDDPSSRALGAALASHARVAAAHAARIAPALAASRTFWPEVEGLASRLDDVGARTGERDTLLASLDIYQDALELVSRDQAPFDWAMTQSNRGTVLGKLGAHEDEPARLEEAIAAFQAALTVRTRDRAPDAWATTQNNLGTALYALGARAEGTTRLEEAATAFRAGLEVSTRERAPSDWSMLQNNLGIALGALGEREAGTVRLEQAVAAFRAALEVRSRAETPLDWAMTQNNLGSTLQTLGEREEGTARLKEAVASFRGVLEIQTRDRSPVSWATALNNLGNALSTLGQREKGTAYLEEAVGAYRMALEIYTRDRGRHTWALTQNNLGAALSRLGEITEEPRYSEEAVTAFRAALEVHTREASPLSWAMTHNNLGNALARLSLREEGTTRLEEAIAAYEGAFDIFMKADHAPYMALAAGNLERSKRQLAERGSGHRRRSEG